MPDNWSDGRSDYGLIIVGAGAAGVAAAIEAAESGQRVLVLEAFSDYGGAARTSGGGCCVVGSPLQAAKGIQDSVELAFADWMRWGGEEADAEWARFYLERSREDVYDWAEAHGVVWEDVLDQVDQRPANSVPRWHRPAGHGEGMMQALWNAALQLGIDYRFSAEVTDLILDADRVVGVVAELNGRRVELRAPAVLVATGGFANNPEMLRQYGPDPGPGGKLICGGAVTALGKGHRLLETVGAQFVNMHWVWTYPHGTPDYLDPAGCRGLVVRGLRSLIWVNAQGRRFHNEDMTDGWLGTNALLSQTPRTCWAIFDRAEADKLSIGEPYYKTLGKPNRERHEALLAKSPWVWRGDSIPELARAVGIPEQALVESVDRLREWLNAGLERDPEFGRDLTGLRPIERPPFYAMQFFPMARKCFGGVRTDLACRVLRPDGSVIPGLYAAGEVAGMAGGHINGRAGLEGTMLGPSLFSGRVAARSIVAVARAAEAVG